MQSQKKNLQFHDELSFIIACCQINLSSEEMEVIYTYIGRQQTNINMIIDIANQHGVLPLVYKTLKHIQTDHPLDETLQYRFKSLYTQVAQQNILMSAELLSLMQLFKENDIDAISFKGPTLAQMAYGDITLRQFGDLDILIKKKDRYKMMDLLTQAHYIPQLKLEDRTKKIFFDSVNVIGFYHPSKAIHIEIHWELFSQNYAIHWQEKTLWHEHVSAMINHKKVRVLPLEQLLPYLCAHGAKHFFERLEWVCDIDRSIRSHPQLDWSYLLNEAEQRGIKRMLLLGLSLAQYFFSLRLPELIIHAMKNDNKLPDLTSKVINKTFLLTSGKGRSYNSFWILLDMRENISDKLRFSWHGLFTPKFDDFKFIQLPKNLVWLYPLVRFYRLLTKYFKHQPTNQG